MLLRFFLFALALSTVCKASVFPGDRARENASELSSEVLLLKEQTELERKDFRAERGSYERRRAGGEASLPRLEATDGRKSKTFRQKQGHDAIRALTKYTQKHQKYLDRYLTSGDEKQLQYSAWFLCKMSEKLRRTRWYVFMWDVYSDTVKQTTRRIERSFTNQWRVFEPQCGQL